jgi:HEAT repeat protein
LIYKALILRAVYLAIMDEANCLSIPACIDALDDPTDKVRGVCMSSLRKAGSKAVPALLDALHDRSLERRRGAIQAIANTIRSRKELILTVEVQGMPIIAESLLDHDSIVRAWAALVYWRVKHDPEVVQTLIELWTTGDHATRFRSKEAFVEIGPEANRAIPCLIESLDDQDPLVRSWAMDALRAIDPERAAKIE